MLLFAGGSAKMANFVSEQRVTMTLSPSSNLAMMVHQMSSYRQCPQCPVFPFLFPGLGVLSSFSVPITKCLWLNNILMGIVVYVCNFNSQE